jgi:2Fe-2S ferredoxin
MKEIKNFIDFVLKQGDEEIRVKTYPREYADLRMLIKDYLKRDDFGQCTGMGRCATCMVTISSNINPLLSQNNRFSNLRLKKDPGRAVKLSCQVIVNDELANKSISLLPGRVA